MLSVNDPIQGWSPIGNSDEDVHISQDMYLTTTASTCVSLAGVTDPSESIASSLDRRAQRNRNRNPSWIPRPRNAFIIFRCEYSRRHSQASSSSQDAQGDHESTDYAVKTLSKRAAEAWKELPPSERERYKMLADKEREEHARLYPHYRFRPMKRQTSGVMKSVPQESTRSARVPSVKHPQAPSTPSTRFPSVLAPAPDKAQSSPSESLEQVYEGSVGASGTATEPLPSHEPSYPIDHQTELPPIMDYSKLGSYMFPDMDATTMLANSLLPSAIHKNNDFEADMIGHYDIFPPFSFQEYY